VEKLKKKLPAYKPKASPADNLEREKREEVKVTEKIKYEGEWIKGTEERNGLGRQVLIDGSVYEGYWRNNKANGQGRLLHADGDAYYGDWVDDKAEGFGIYENLQGSRYEGEWKFDKQNGLGVESWDDESKFEGLYVDGKK
jgi:hypothetical protein